MRAWPQTAGSLVNLTSCLSSVITETKNQQPKTGIGIQPLNLHTRPSRSLNENIQNGCETYIKHHKIVIWVFPKEGYPRMDGENPIKMDDFRVPLFLETPINWWWIPFRLPPIRPLACHHYHLGVDTYATPDGLGQGWWPPTSCSSTNQFMVFEERDVSSLYKLRKNP